MFQLLSIPSSCHGKLQWWNVIKYCTHLRHYFAWKCLPVLHYILEGNIVLFTSLFDSFSFQLIYKFTIFKKKLKKQTCIGLDMDFWTAHQPLPTGICLCMQVGQRTSGYISDYQSVYTLVNNAFSSTRTYMSRAEGIIWLVYSRLTEN